MVSVTITHVTQHNVKNVAFFARRNWWHRAIVISCMKGWRWTIQAHLHSPISSNLGFEFEFEFEKFL